MGSINECIRLLEIAFDNLEDIDTSNERNEYLLNQTQTIIADVIEALMLLRKELLKMIGENEE
ncbi:MAG: hypothetical protein ACTSX6_10540 [Candidatus Heimdallarchaeaceae archaeon]